MHFTISCDSCTMRDTDACSDCIVPMLCGESPDGAIVFDIDEMRTINVMAKVGLVPTLRHHADERSTDGQRVAGQRSGSGGIARAT